MFLNWLDFIVVNKKGIIRENDKTAIYIENNIPRVPTNVAIEKLTEFIPKAYNKPVKFHKLLKVDCVKTAAF